MLVLAPIHVFLELNVEQFSLLHRKSFATAFAVNINARIKLLRMYDELYFGCDALHGANVLVGLLDELFDVGMAR